MQHVAVVGASIAGVSAVQALRERGFRGQLTLLDGDDRLPYDKPPLSKRLLAGTASERDVCLRPRQWYADLHVDLQLGRRVESLNARSRVLGLEGGSSMAVDGIVIATGASARPLPVPVDERVQVHRLRTLADARALVPQLVAGRHLAVIGAGFIGLEAAAVARARGMGVTVLEAARSPLQRVLGPEAGQWFRELHESNGVRIECSAQLSRVEHRDGRHLLVLNDGREIAADVVLAGVGAAPETGWLEGSGLHLDNGVVCGPDLATGLDGIVAAGDATRWRNPLFGHLMRVEHWTNAVEQGHHASGTLLGGSLAYQAVPYFWSDQYDAKVRFVGTSLNFDEVALDEPRPGSFLALFGRAGVLRAALCVNLPRRLTHYRTAIEQRTSWRDAISTISSCPPGRIARPLACGPTT